MSDTATDALAKGSRRAAGVSGGHPIDICDGCVDEDVCIFDTQRERVAAFAR